MGADPFLGEICMFAGNYAPSGWHFCDGSLLPISANQALFSLLSTYYGGNGTTNFALPDLRGRFPLGAGSVQGLSPRQLGDKAGAEKLTLQAPNMPAHAHPIVPTKPITATLKALNDAANLSSPEEAWIATPGTNVFRESGSPIPMSSGSISVDASGISSTQPVGQGTPVDSMPPFQAISFIIATTGIYPPRD
jgi:microcystin-dependent protein